MSKKVAILVDGDFFIRCYKSHLKKQSGDKYKDLNPEKLAHDIHTHCLRHINKKNEELYRIFFYDCKPLEKRVHYPHTQKALDLSKSSTYKERKKLHKHLISKPCLALRLGYLDEKNAKWVIRDQEKEKKLFNRKISIEEFQNDDFIYHAKQKGVDIKIGLDIATLAVKHPTAKAIGLPRLMLPVGRVWFSLCVPNHRDFTEFELQRIPYRSHTSYLQRRNFAHFLR
ncbi:NYN domain-containing protein [Helicobacter pylori]|uniref:NYN domain-containing protein n=1 Tax=Helicobacter pylori TaxID=210 RepID=UPI0020CA68DB|nr:NYN domain-containing protein [Helicobacter pylori]